MWTYAWAPAHRSDPQQTEAATQINVSPSEGLWTHRFGGEEKGWAKGENDRTLFCICLSSKSLFLQLLLLLAGLTPLLLMEKQLKLQPIQNYCSESLALGAERISRCDGWSYSGVYKKVSLKNILKIYYVHQFWQIWKFVKDKREKSAFTSRVKLKAHWPNPAFVNIFIWPQRFSFFSF